MHELIVSREVLRSTEGSGAIPSGRKSAALHLRIQKRGRRGFFALLIRQSKASYNVRPRLPGRPETAGSTRCLTLCSGTPLATLHERTSDFAFH